MRRRRPPPLLAGLVTALLALTAALTACGGPESLPARAVDAPGPEALAGAGKVTVTFWHSMKGRNGQALDALVDAFNAGHAGRIEIRPIFQGNYDEVVTKYKIAVQQRQTPTLVQIYDIGTRFMIDSRQTVPIQSFVDKDRFPLADIEPNIANYYTLDGALRAMPFNSSMPLLYLNAEAFRRAGLDPASPPRTLDELTDAARKLTVKDAAGRTVQYGFGAAVYGWFLEQFTAQSGNLYCDADNGRSGDPTRALLDSAPVVTLAQWWSRLVADGYAINLGRRTDDAQAAFRSGRVAMNLESTGVLGAYIDGARGRFTVATAPFPKIAAGNAGGPVIGGASLWINGVGHSDAAKRAAWEFAKFAVSPAQQARWSTATGYFPVNREALDEPEAAAWRQKYPQFQVAIDQLHTTRPTPATAGCLMGVMPQARQVAEAGLENAITGEATPHRAMREAANSIEPMIRRYNEALDATDGN